MGYLNKLVVSISALLICGCVVAADPGKSNTEQSVRDLPSSFALRGTSTALVGIALSDSGFPLETVKEVVLRPGQKAVFAGPNKFEIVFKNRKSPTRVTKYESINGVVSIDIPRDIFELKAFKDEGQKNNQIVFHYAIKVNGKELDPPMIIRRDN